MKKLAKYYKERYSVTFEGIRKAKDPFPKDINILGVPFDIYQYEKAVDDETGQDIYGFCAFDNSTILISDNCRSEGVKKEIFFHEVLHALDVVAGTGLSEFQVRTLGYLLRNLFINEKVMKKWVI